MKIPVHSKVGKSWAAICCGVGVAVTAMAVGMPAVLMGMGIWTVFVAMSFRSGVAAYGKKNESTDDERGNNSGYPSFHVESDFGKPSSPLSC